MKSSTAGKHCFAFSFPRSPLRENRLSSRSPMELLKFVRYISDRRILNIPKRTHLRPKPLSFGSMLSLVTTTGAVEVYLLGCYTVSFSVSDS